MARVVAYFIDMRSDQFRKSVVLLQVHRERGSGIPTDLGQGLDILFAIDGNADNIGSGFLEQVYLMQRSGNVLGAGRRHALHRNGVAGANGGGAYFYRSGGIALDFVHGYSLPGE